MFGKKNDKQTFNHLNTKIMRLYKYMLATSVFLLGFISTGCSDTDKWTPGPQDTNVGVCAYFEKPATTSFIFGTDTKPEDMVIEVPVKRQKTEGEATVGISIKTDCEEFSCPASVIFEDGKADSSFSIDCSGLPKSAFYNITVELAEDQTDIYGIGTNQLTFSAIKADWILLADQARYLYMDYSYANIYPQTYGELYQLEGTKMFKLTDFFGSGLDITFECKSPSDEVLYPLQNADFENVYDEDKVDNGWYLYDEANSKWPSWTPGDAAGYPAIEYLLFYASADYNGCNMIYNEDTLYGYMWFTAGVNFDNGTFAWDYFQIDFNLKYNPFE